MKNTRLGMGKGRGVGYYNIAPLDSHIHSLSAKGVKSIINKYSSGKKLTKSESARIGHLHTRVFGKKCSLKASGSDEPLEVIEKGNKRGEIYVDENPESPRTWDNLGTMATYHRDYNFGGKGDIEAQGFDSLENLKQYLIKEKGAVVVLPLVILDHSGVSMRVGSSFAEDVGGWDTSKVGFIYASKDNVKKEYGKITPATLKKAEEILRGEVETYDQYLTGDVYGFKIIEKQKVNIKGIRDFKGKLENEKETDSCWGFYGIDSVRDEINSILKQTKVK